MIHILNRKRGVTTGGGGSSWPDIDGISYVNFISTSAAIVNPRGIYFKDDGTKMYQSTGGTIYQWSLSTAWDITSATYDSVSHATGGNFSGCGIKIRNGGTELYMANYQTETIYQSTMSTPWDLSTASATGTTTITEATSDGVRDIDFNTDGTKLFVLWNSDDTVREYPLSSAWDITSRGSETTSFDVSSQGTNLRGLFFDQNGGFRFIVLDQGSIGDLYQYSCSTGFDLTTASYDSVTTTGLGPPTDTAMHGIYIKADGSKVYLSGITNDRVYEYDLS